MWGSGSIDGGLVSGRGVLRLGRGIVLKLEKGFFDITGHGSSEFAFGVIPVQGNPNEFCASPVGSGRIGFLNDGLEVQDIIFVSECDAKVIYDEGE